MQIGYLAINTEEDQRLMLSITKTTEEGAEATVLVDTEASASFLQTNWSKRNAIDIYTSNDAYQVRISMG